MLYVLKEGFYVARRCGVTMGTLFFPLYLFFFVWLLIADEAPLPRGCPSPLPSPYAPPARSKEAVLPMGGVRGG